MPPTPLREALRLLGHLRADLPSDLAQAAVAEILDGDAEPAAIGAFLAALSVRGESAAALAGAVRAVRSRMIHLDVPEGLRPILDTCGTGGDGASTVNVSTAASVVVAACGIRVAKHGNRSASGNSGSAEVLRELGVAIEAEPSVLLRCLEDVGIAFLFAPSFHPTLRHAAAARRLLPFRTLFNLVGPLANPALPDAHLLGVPDEDRADLVVRALRDLHEGGGSPPPRAFVVVGSDGLDEVTLTGDTYVRQTHGWVPGSLCWGPSDFGLGRLRDNGALVVAGPGESASKIRAMLRGEVGPVRDVVLANAAAALLLVQKAETLADGVAIASEAIDRGDAARLLERWAAASS